ncbi:uncharacterized protein LOC124294836 [Neodiprion lecontei]|uniref:Uncharacterized protein LOC124294836 n=1 Tax=Neodiprion lecontei TaxID=441921 RepID=A0ABM3GDG7_NEOLC|nr:uncharacterized protein LOC124294836 [Neodiprion lecontei]
MTRLSYYILIVSIPDRAKISDNILQLQPKSRVFSQKLPHLGNPGGISGRSFSSPTLRIIIRNDSGTRIVRQGGKAGPLTPSVSYRLWKVEVRRSILYGSSTEKECIKKRRIVVQKVTRTALKSNKDAENVGLQSFVLPTEYDKHNYAV